MFSVAPEVFNPLWVGSRWLFAFIALLLLLFAFSWLRSERKERRDKVKKLPGAGTVGELIVISGGDELAPDTWFPVPREGVLGALRSCDLVVPCPGVRPRHLDFSWQDGTGLLIRPRSGCEALVDGVPVTARATGERPALIHGSFLQVGSALLRLQLFSALDHTNRTYAPAAPAGPDTESLPPAAPGYPAVPGTGNPFPPEVYPAPAEAPLSPDPFPGPGYPPVPPEASSVPVDVPGPADAPGPADPYRVSADPPAPPESASAGRRVRRSDRWKEDWSE